MLNKFWGDFFITSFVFAIYTSCLGDFSVWTSLVMAVFSSSKLAFSICLNLTGILCFWLGILKVAEVSGITNLLARGLYPLFKRIIARNSARQPSDWVNCDESGGKYAGA